MSFIETFRTEDLKKLDLVSGYYYWISVTDINKLLGIKNDEYYLPCYSFDIKINNFNELIDTDVLLLMNKPKIIYGILKIKSILIKEKEEKKELEYLKQNLELTQELTQMVSIDTEKFMSFINIFSLANVNELFFIKFEKIFEFEFKIDFYEFNKYLKNNLSEITYEFKYPKKINDKNIIKSYSPCFLNLCLLDYLNILKKNNEKNTSLDLNEKSIIDQTNNLNNLSDNYINFDVPILFNGCEIIKKSFKGEITIKRKILLEHFEKCKKCEINNNGNKIEFNKKIVIKIIFEKKNYKIFEEIISSYHNIKKIVLKEDNDDLFFEKEKINIILSHGFKNLYSDCIFILHK